MDRGIRTVALLTLLFIYLVIIAGSVVRTTGSGMGCPDWPKCFGQWIPPTDISQLPVGYEADFLAQRKEKLDKYIDLLDAIGFHDIAAEMRADDRLLVAEPFDALGTWIEYLNRVVGFMAGNLMLLLFILSLWKTRSDPVTPILAFVSLVAIGFQAWLGSVVVATNLTPWLITVHMIVAFFIIALLISIHNRRPGVAWRWQQCRPLLMLAIVMTLLQVVLGTQVRQEIDVLHDNGVLRGEWIEALSGIFEVHRSLSILLLLVNGYLLYHYWVKGRSWRWLGAVLFGEVVVGIVLAYFALPHVAQPTHLLLATLLFGVQWHLWSSREGVAEAPMRG